MPDPATPAVAAPATPPPSVHNPAATPAEAAPPATPANGKPADAPATPPPNGAPASGAAPAEPKPTEDDFLKRWESLNHTARAQQQQHARVLSEAQQVKAAGEALKKEYEAKFAELNETFETFKKNPFEAAKKRGIDPDHALQTYMADGKPPVEATLQQALDKIAALEKAATERDERDKKATAERETWGKHQQVQKVLEGETGDRWDAIKLAAAGAPDPEAQLHFFRGQALELQARVAEQGAPRLGIPPGGILPLDKALDIVEADLIPRLESVARALKKVGYEKKATATQEPPASPASAPPTDSSTAPIASPANKSAAARLVNRTVEQTSHKRKAPAKPEEAARDPEELKARKWRQIMGKDRVL